MADEQNKGEPAAALPVETTVPDVSSAPRQFRSKQQTLAMGGNVNYRERMPTLREVAEEFVVVAPPLPEQAPPPEPEPTSMTELAARTVRESTLPDEPRNVRPAVPYPSPGVSKPVYAPSPLLVPASPAPVVDAAPPAQPVSTDDVADQLGSDSVSVPGSVAVAPPEAPATATAEEPETSSPSAAEPEDAAPEGQPPAAALEPSPGPVEHPPSEIKSPVGAFTSGTPSADAAASTVVTRTGTQAPPLPPQPPPLPADAFAFAASPPAPLTAVEPPAPVAASPQAPPLPPNAFVHIEVAPAVHESSATFEAAGAGQSDSTPQTEVPVPARIPSSGSVDGALTVAESGVEHVVPGLAAVQRDTASADAGVAPGEHVGPQMVSGSLDAPPPTSNSPAGAPETFAAQVMQQPAFDDSFADSAFRPHGLRARWEAMSVRQRQWATVGGGIAAAVLLGFAAGPLLVGGETTPTAEQQNPALSPVDLAPAAQPASSPAPAAEPEQPPAEANEGEVGGDEAKPAVDSSFAVRKPEKAASCADVLETAFEVEAKPHAGKSGAFWSRSRKSLMRGKTEQAVKEMCLSAAWDISGRGTYGLSEFYFRASDFAQAASWADRVPKDSKRYRDARATLGDVYSHQGRVDAALGVYLEHWGLSAGNADERAEVAGRFVNSAAKALRKNDWWTAENLYRRAAVLDPKSVLAAAGMSRVLLHADLVDAALRWAERGVVADPASVHGALALCEVRVIQKDKAEAERALQRLQELAPTHPRVRVLAKHIADLE